MTVADIKEYIDERLIIYKDKRGKYFTPVDNYFTTLQDIKFMLDELENEDAEYICETQRGLKDLDE